MDNYTIIACVFTEFLRTQTMPITASLRRTHRYLLGGLATDMTLSGIYYDDYFIYNCRPNPPLYILYYILTFGVPFCQGYFWLFLKMFPAISAAGNLGMCEHAPLSAFVPELAQRFNRSCCCSHFATHLLAWLGVLSSSAS